MSKKEYRYRSGRCGVTRYSVERLHHLVKVGRVQYIRACAYLSRKDSIIRLAIIVRGDRGYARYEGLCFGYYGEGPHGLRRLFEALNVPEPIAKRIAHDTKSPDWSKVREYWRLDCSPNGNRYELRIYDADNNVVEYKVFEITETAQPVQLRLVFTA